jgi:hypothetical protein
MTLRHGTRIALRLPALLGLGLLAGCQQPGGGEGIGFNDAQGPGEPHSGQVSPLLGTLGGAGAGALLGRVLAGGHDNTAAILGGALLGGLAGNFGTNYYNTGKERQATAQVEQQQLLSSTQQQLAQQQAAQRQEQQRLADTQQRLAQQEAVNRQLEAQAQYDQWAAAQGHPP